MSFGKSWKPTGLGTALVTPFTKELEVDYSGLRRLVEYQISGGVDFLVAGGTTGESATLSDDELVKVAEAVVETANGRVPVIAGAGGNDTGKIVRLIRRYEALGLDGLLSVTPYYNKPTQSGLEAHYRAIAQSTDLPILLYNVPPRTNVNLLPETVAKLADIPNVVGLKEASGDVSQIADILSRVPSSFKVFSGDDALILPVIALGGVGVISVVSNELPGVVAELVGYALAGQFEDARILARRIQPLVKANFVETNPAPAKAALALLGIIEEHLRLPLVPVHPANREKLRLLLDEFGVLSRELVAA
jgi:4-hydroxy-tetrahydrodipicolinate synthase